jgi:hypothetical protein
MIANIIVDQLITTNIGHLANNTKNENYSNKLHSQ